MVILDTIMNRMANHYEKEFKINNKIKGAMAYPVVLSVIAISVIVFNNICYANIYGNV